MSKVLVLYYSSYGHVEQMAIAVANGAREAGASVDIKRVPETVAEDVARAAHFKLDQTAPIATVADLDGYDAIILGLPTRFGRMPSQVTSFLDQAGGLWMRGVLNGKVGAAFTSTASQHGGQETTLFSAITNLLHFGMVVVGLPYSFQGLMGAHDVHGGTPYGASTIAGGEPRGDRGTKLRQLCWLLMDDREAARKAIQHYRRLREWVTDPHARRALRELIRDVEGKLTAHGELAEEEE